MLTMAETVPFLDGGHHSEDIMPLMKKGWFWTNNSLLWIPEGVYIEDNPRIEGNQVYRMNKRDLKQRVDNKDENVRYVPYASHSKLDKEEFLIGLAGEEGAKKLVKVTDKHKVCERRSCLPGGLSTALLHGFPDDELKLNIQPVQRVGALTIGQKNNSPLTILFIDGWHHVTSPGYIFARMPLKQPDES